tara:strand:- start:2367 stop:2618 length:252 start_codon:yes stop_codon:yes gene_type:complete
MGTRTDKYINNIITVLGEEELTSREVHDKIIDLKVNGRTRRLVPTYRQVVVLLQGNPKFVMVTERKLPKGRKLRVWRNKNAMD